MVSAIIVNFHCHDLTARAAQSVFKDDPSAQIIVIDNSESESEKNALRYALPKTAELLLSQSNIGFGNACNLGLERAKGEWILLLNPDAFIIKGCLNTLVKTLMNNPDAGAASPVAYWDEAGDFLLPPGQMQSPAWEWILTFGEIIPCLGRWLSFHFQSYALQCLSASQALPQKMLSGAHILLRRSTIDAIDYFFDKNFFLYYEDTDLCRRITSAGYQLLLIPSAKAVHQWQNHNTKFLYSAKSRAIYMKKHFFYFGFSEFFLRKINCLKKNVFDFKELGICKKPPVFDIPTNQSGKWIIEISPNPLLIPAIISTQNTPISSLPLSVWNLLCPSRYWARITSPLGTVKLFSWSITE